MTDLMENYACFCFNSVAVDEAEVDELINTVHMGEESDAQPARQRIREIYSLMRKHRAPIAIGASYAIRECMDAAFIQHLGPGTEVEDIFSNQRQNRWKDAVCTYMQQIIDDLPGVVTTMKTTGASMARNEEEQGALDCLQWCVAKVKVLRFLLSRTVAEKTLGVLPFMSRSVYVHMARRLDLIEEAVMEVSIVSPHFHPVRLCGLDRC